ncbi:SDR family NAD(P)-dependent oxidoreductase [Cohnella rhizosphaerae]|uniref:SDR family NAD(P)-dependent oxidoreductase n=1 Tax=Cohnella rhizosphaerae TaxID=1457232 RepID=A0A9X4KW65_9BACL|nr:SDR family NAD(P)-dependent oxidoreductase [Cohnella rhizosphaerae]MDG0811878.1 SDR family NAD(P)-dependent oxidoreductase [Cohnella rhizosphaerae]
MIGLDGKVVWITGASRGIGKATAEAFAASGANLALNATDAEALSLVADTLKARFGIQCLVLPYDVSREEAVKAAAREIQSAFGRLDVLVNNAGLMRDAAIGMLRSEDMVRTMEVNVQGPLNHMQLASRLMMRKKRRCHH